MFDNWYGNWQYAHDQQRDLRRAAEMHRLFRSGRRIIAPSVRPVRRHKRLALALALFGMR
ncbi:MAG TPA: hypothetical protein VKY59_02120 [Spirillospora sp.]|nr:hypothetical protein [Spirillospora sp.]